MFRLLILSRCGEGRALLSRLRCSGSRLLYMERALRCARFQPSGVPQKRRVGCPCVCAFPGPSSSGSQELHGCTLPRCSAPSALRSPSPIPRQQRSRVPAPCVSPGPSRQMSTIQNLRRSLITNWRPVCSAVGAAVLEAEPAPFPSPPASSLRRGWTGK